MEIRCILFLDTSESGVYVESRCIWNIWFYAHTSEMPDSGPFRCIIALVSVGDTSGLRFQFPSRCTEVQYQLNNTSGWANTGYFRSIASNRKNKIHRNPTIYGNPDVSKSNIHRKLKFSSNPDAFQLISREYTDIPSQHTPARINLTLISREYTCFPSQSTPAQAGFTVICAEIRFRWKYVATRVAYFDSF